MKTIEYRVRPVTRYVVTRWHHESSERGESGGSEQCGEFDNEEQAVKVMSALASSESKLLGCVPLMEDGKSIRWAE